MAKRKNNNANPIVEGLLDALSMQFSVIITVAGMDFGPEGAVTVIDKIIAKFNEQREELLRSRDEYMAKVEQDSQVNG